MSQPFSYGFLDFCFENQLSDDEIQMKIFALHDFMKKTGKQPMSKEQFDCFFEFLKMGWEDVAVAYLDFCNNETETINLSSAKDDEISNCLKEQQDHNEKAKNQEIKEKERKLRGKIFVWLSVVLSLCFLGCYFYLDIVNASFFDSLLIIYLPFTVVMISTAIILEVSRFTYWNISVHQEIKEKERKLRRKTFVWLSVVLSLCLLGCYLYLDIVNASCFDSLLIIYTPFTVVMISTAIILNIVKVSRFTYWNISVRISIIYAMISAMIVSNGFWGFYGSSVVCFVANFVILVAGIGLIEKQKKMI